MRAPAQIEAWLSTEDLQVSVRKAPDKGAYQRRLAIWLTSACRLPAYRVAEWFWASKQAVWLSIAQYNQHGPTALSRAGWGRRRRAWLSWEKEERFLENRQQALQEQILTAPQLRAELEKLTQRRVSLAYVYRPLRGGREQLPRRRRSGGFRKQAIHFRSVAGDGPPGVRATSAKGTASVGVWSA